jgi:hypothetical protein
MSELASARCHTTFFGEPIGQTPPAFSSAEGLRSVLNRLHTAGGRTWQTDREARELMLFAVAKYRRLAAKWHRDEADAAHAAFLAMLAPSTRRANDPWAVVTVAVSRTLKAEARAEEHLVSTERARHLHKLATDAPIRVGEHTEFVFDMLHRRDTPVDIEQSDMMLRTHEAARFLSLLGWPEAVATGIVEYVTDRLISAGNREAAFQSLRRDFSIPALFTISPASWTQLIRALLGGSLLSDSPARQGILARVVCGDTAVALLDNTPLVMAVIDATDRRSAA